MPDKKAFAIHVTRLDEQPQVKPIILRAATTTSLQTALAALDAIAASLPVCQQPNIQARTAWVNDTERRITVYRDGNAIAVLRARLEIVNR